MRDQSSGEDDSPSPDVTEMVAVLKIERKLTAV